MDKDVLNELLNEHSPYCATFFLPTHQAGVEVNEDHDVIAFKNQINEAQQQLKSLGFNASETNNFLNKVLQLLKKEMFWKNLSKSLAVFVGEDFFKVMKLPISVKPEVYVGNSFYITPLIKTITNNEYGYILTLSKNTAALYKCDRQKIEQVPIENLPKGIEEIMKSDEKDELQTYRMRNVGLGQGSFYGHGSDFTDEKVYITKYLKAIDHTLQTALLSTEQAPLWLAGLETITGIYKQITHYKYLMPEVLQGNFETNNVNELLEKARPILSKHLGQHEKIALENYYNKLATPLTSSIPEKVIEASFYKQIADLFVEEDIHIWGTFDATKSKIKLYETKQVNNTCLINKAIVNTLTNGGNVFILPKEKMPNNATICASFRF